VFADLVEERLTFRAELFEVAEVMIKGGDPTVRVAGETSPFEYGADIGLIGRRRGVASKHGLRTRGRWMAAEEGQGEERSHGLQL
jgi:hypothetical protein